MDEPFIIELTTDAVAFVHHYTKFSTFINHYIEKATRDQMTIEFIENGIIYCFKTLAVFEHLVKAQEITPYTEHQSALSKMMTYILYPKSKFPSDGLSFHVKFITPLLEKVSTLHPFYQYFQHLSKDIVLDISSDQEITVHYPTYESFTVYIKNFIINFKFISETD